MSKPIIHIIERPVVTEKSVRLSQAGRYTFRCRTAANKIEIGLAIESLYETKVADVHTLIVKGRRKQVRQARPGRTADWKKAIVTLAPGARDNRLKEIFEGA
jgi:large subunit ribosomal protein L23